jgi:integrase
MPIGKHSVLQSEEIAAVLRDLATRQHTPNGRINLVIFRLACFYGLRVGEISGLKVSDITYSAIFPTLTVRKTTTKGKDSYGQERVIPLQLDAGACADLTTWLIARVDACRGRCDVPVLTGASEAQNPNGALAGLSEAQISRRWKTAIRCLGSGRVRQLSIHKGRHTFISHLLNAKYSIPEVQQWAGHRSLSSTMKYTHLLTRIEYLENPFGLPTEPVQQSRLRVVG